jgi:biotin transport system substrate-specific component
MNHLRLENQSQSHQGAMMRYVSQPLVMYVLSVAALVLSGHIYLNTQPVPFTLQSMVVLLVGLLGYARISLYSVLTYIGLALIGLPVLADHQAGLAIVAMPTFGYLVGFVVAIAALGVVKDYLKTASTLQVFLAVFIAHKIIFVFGVLGLSLALHSFSAGWMYGYLPFALFDVVKVVVVTCTYLLIRRVV